MYRYKKMKLWQCFGIIFLFSLLTAFLKKDHAMPEPFPVANGFAIVELFTSEGCSSCPPADAVAEKLATEFPGRVYVLGYHVDYWNYLGWKDIYSQPAFTERQRQYASLFSLNSIYTPQVVVNGKTELVGSKENELRKTITAALKNATPVALSLSEGNHHDHTISVNYSSGEDGRLSLALVQNHAVSDVKRGENSGRQLRHINVVRDLKTVTVTKHQAGTATLTLPAGLSAQAVSVIGFVQHPQSLEVLAAGEIRNLK